MAKIQKTLMLPQDVHSLIHAIEERSGANFSRIMVAAVLDYLFGGLYPDYFPRGIGPDHVWMQLAVQIERGDCKVGEIPGALLDSAIRSTEQTIESYRRDLERAKAKDRPRLERKVEELVERVRMAKEYKRGWESNVEDFGGEMNAILDRLGDLFTRKS